jgi:hypothetical protein
MRLRALVLLAHVERTRTLSYQYGWPRALARFAGFDCTFVDVARPLAAARVAAAARRRHDVVVALHSVFANEQFLRGAALRVAAALRAPKALFLGNEYKQMPEKVAFARTLGADLLVSQLYDEAALDLYRAALGCRVVSIPNTGLDEELFRPRTPLEQRPVDIGYRSYDAPAYLGHRERALLAGRFAEAAARRGLRTDISLDPAARLAEEDWAAFLDRCRGQLGSEAGGDYFELTDATRNAVSAYEAGHPGASFDDLHARFFRDYPSPVSGRALSGRIVEAAGTKTVQILVEGRYGGYFEPWEHYIPVRADVADVEQALDALADDALCRRIADAAYEVATTELTYERLVGRLHGALTALV